MKISKSQLKRIIKEERTKLQEQAYLSPGSPEYDAAVDNLDMDFRNALANATEAGLIMDDLEDAWQNALAFVEMQLNV